MKIHLDQKCSYDPPEANCDADLKHPKTDHRIAVVTCIPCLWLVARRGDDAKRRLEALRDGLP